MEGRDRMNGDRQEDTADSSRVELSVPVPLCDSWTDKYFGGSEDESIRLNLVLRSEVQ